MQRTRHRHQGQRSGAQHRHQRGAADHAQGSRPAKGHQHGQGAPQQPGQAGLQFVGTDAAAMDVQRPTPTAALTELQVPSVSTIRPPASPTAAWAARRPRAAGGLTARPAPFYHRHQGSARTTRMLAQPYGDRSSAACRRSLAAAVGAWRADRVSRGPARAARRGTMEDEERLGGLRCGHQRGAKAEKWTSRCPVPGFRHPRRAVQLRVVRAGRMPPVSVSVPVMRPRPRQALMIALRSAAIASCCGEGSTPGQHHQAGRHRIGERR